MKKFAAVLIVASVATMCASAGKPSKVAPDISSTNPNAQVDVIIRYKTAPTKDELKQLGAYGQIKKQYSIIKGIRITLSVSAINAIAVDPNVAYISPNRKTKSRLDISTATVNANLVWSYGYDGTGVGIAVSDSGGAPGGGLARTVGRGGRR